VGEAANSAVAADEKTRENLILQPRQHHEVRSFGLGFPQHVNRMRVLGNLEFLDYYTLELVANFVGYQPPGFISLGSPYSKTHTSSSVST
jgi:hypothetical protein